MNASQTLSPAARISYLLTISLVCCCCTSRPDGYRLAAGAEGSTLKVVGEGIANVTSKDGRLRVRALSGKEFTGKHNVDLLIKGDVDFALAQSDLRSDQQVDFKGKAAQVRTVLPLYPQILFIIYKDSLQPRDLADLLRGRRVCVGPYTSGTARFTKKLFKAFGIDSTEYTPVYTAYDDRRLSDTVDVCCAIGGFTNSNIRQILRYGRCKLMSLDSVTLAGRGSSVDGFCLNYEGARPYIIPKNSLGRFPEEPVLSVAVDALLVTRADVPSEVVYDMAAAIIDNRSSLIEIDPILRAVTERFDPNTLSYPLHEGVTAYLHRDEPSFIEEHSDLIGIVITIAVTLGGAVSGLIQWRARRQRARIDLFYGRVGKVERRIELMTTADECRRGIEEVQEIRREALDLLIRERLAADESFRIFITLADDTIASIRERMNEGVVMGESIA